jgi:hypothetical protein
MKINRPWHSSLTIFRPRGVESWLLASVTMAGAWTIITSGQIERKQPPIKIVESKIPQRQHTKSNALSTDWSSTLGKAFGQIDLTQRECQVRDLLTHWAMQDPEAALNWAASQENPAVRRSARSTVCHTVAEKDPRRAVELALAHDADQESDDTLLDHLAMLWLQKEAIPALEWARGQPGGEWKDRLLSKLSFVLSKSDPVTAAQLVADLPSGEMQDEAAIAVLHQWALQDASAARQWATGFSEPGLRERAYAEIPDALHGTSASPTADVP